MIKWKLPDNNEPGFLRRKRDLTALLDAPPSPSNMDKMLYFLLPFVDADNPKEVLLDASKAEYGEAIIHLLGYGSSVPDPKGESSGQQ